MCVQCSQLPASLMDLRLQWYAVINIFLNTTLVSSLNVHFWISSDLVLCFVIPALISPRSEFLCDVVCPALPCHPSYFNFSVPQSFHLLRESILSKQRELCAAWSVLPVFNEFACYYLFSMVCLSHYVISLSMSFMIGTLHIQEHISHPCVIIHLVSMHCLC